MKLLLVVNFIWLKPGENVEVKELLFMAADQALLSRSLTG